MIVQRKVCDVCHGESGAITDAVATRTLTLDRKGIELDVCQGHDEGLAAAISVFMEAGRRVRNTRPARQPEPEPEPTPIAPFTCTCGRTFASQRGLTRHVNFPPVESQDDHAVAA